MEELIGSGIVSFGGRKYLGCRVGDVGGCVSLRPEYGTITNLWQGSLSISAAGCSAEKIRVCWKGRMVEGCGGRGYRLLRGDGAEVVAGRKNIFRAASDTQRGRDRKERSRTEYCWDLEERNNHRIEIVALLVHSLGHGRLRGVLMAWWWGSLKDLERDPFDLTAGWV